MSGDRCDGEVSVCPVPMQTIAEVPVGYVGGLGAALQAAYGPVCISSRTSRQNMGASSP